MTDHEGMKGEKLTNKQVSAATLWVSSAQLLILCFGASGDIPLRKGVRDLVTTNSE